MKKVAIYDDIDPMASAHCSMGKNTHVSANNGMHHANHVFTFSSVTFSVICVMSSSAAPDETTQTPKYKAMYM